MHRRSNAAGTFATGCYAAVNVATGEVLGRITRRHRATEFRQFLVQIDRATLPDLALHLIVERRGLLEGWLGAKRSRRRRRAG